MCLLSNTSHSMSLIIYKINTSANKFFVEVRYDSESNKIIGLKSFKHGHLMDKYTGDITF